MPNEEVTSNERRLDDWLTSYLEYTTHTESPETFHLWSGIAMLASTLGRKVMLPKGPLNATYPNHYIIFVSSTGNRKSSAAEMAINVHNNIFTEFPITSKRITLEKFLLNLAKIYKVKTTSSATLFSDELSVLVGRTGTCEMMDFLTEAYNCPEVWDNETKTKGVDRLKLVCINFLACTTPEDLGRLPDTIVNGGFSGRNIFVYSDELRPAIPDPEIFYTEKMIKLRDDLAHDLSIINHMHGKYQKTEEAVKYYNKEYEKNYYSKAEDFRVEPFRQRHGSHVDKLSMIVAASRHNKLIIDEHDIKAAISFLKEVEINIPKAFEGVAYSASTKHLETIYKRISQIEAREGAANHSVVLKSVAHLCNAEEFKKIIQTLEESAMIRAYRDGRGTYYSVKPKEKTDDSSGFSKDRGAENWDY